MRIILIVLAVVGAALVWSSRQRRPALPEFQDAVHTTSARTRLGDCLREFDTVWNESFLHGKATREMVYRLTDLADACQSALQSVKAALPHDIERHAELSRIAEAVQEDHFNKLEELRYRCGSPLLYPRPLDDLHYRRFVRAAHDPADPLSRTADEGVPLSAVWSSS